MQKISPAHFLLLAIALSSAALTPARAENFRDDQIIFDIRENGIEAIAKRLRFYYEYHGLGIHELRAGSSSISAFEPGWGCSVGATPAQLRKNAAKPKPLILSYSSHNQVPASVVNAWNSNSWHQISVAGTRHGQVNLSATLFLTHGVTFRTVVEHVRRFSVEVREFESLLKQYRR